MKAAETKNPSSRSPQDAESSGQKKVYTAPVLTDYGPIGKLTQTGSAVGADATSMRIGIMMCL